LDLQLHGKTAIVTGASMGLGRATAKALAAEGVKVFAVSRTQALLESLADEIRATGAPEPVCLACDFVATEPPRVSRRPIGLSLYAAIGMGSRAA
jgi:3-oxoacyl-[acyl-carrier protein] reductase